MSDNKLFATMIGVLGAFAVIATGLIHWLIYPLGWLAAGVTALILWIVLFTAMIWYCERQNKSKLAPVAPDRPARGGVRIVVGDARKDLDQLASGKACILCGCTLTTAVCEEGHDVLMYYAYDNTWATSSEQVADQLIAKGFKYELSPSGTMWTFRQLKWQEPQIQKEFSQLWAKSAGAIAMQKAMHGLKLTTDQHLEKKLTFIAEQLKPKYGLSNADMIALLEDFLTKRKG